jgi:hypothetical protein
MSEFMQIDPRILEHPKFVRAVRTGGSAPVHLWLGIRSWQEAHDLAPVPHDLIDEPRGPLKPEVRAEALRVLLEVGLLLESAEGYTLHGLADWTGDVNQRRLDRARKRRERAELATAAPRGNFHAEPVRGTSDSSSRVPVTPCHGQDRDRDRDRDEDRDGSAPSRDTVCPLTLHETFGAYAQLATALQVPESELRKAAAEFVSYWTIGGGMGRRQGNWARKLREHLRIGVRDGRITAPKANPHEPPPVTPEQLRAARDRARAENRARLEAAPLDGPEVGVGSENASTGQPGGSNGIGEAALRELGI